MKIKSRGIYSILVDMKGLNDLGKDIVATDEDIVATEAIVFMLFIMYQYCRIIYVERSN